MSNQVKPTIKNQDARLSSHSERLPTIPAEGITSPIPSRVTTLDFNQSSGIFSPLIKGSPKLTPPPHQQRPKLNKIQSSITSSEGLGLFKTRTMKFNRHPFSKSTTMSHSLLSEDDQLGGNFELKLEKALP
jgi:hypothetical protein